MPKLRVANWSTYQHYKDRNPPWIKLHTKLLESYDFERLQDASKAHALCIMLLAARTENHLPDDPAWIGRHISATSKVDLPLLLNVGFLEACDCKQCASGSLADRKPSRARGETETETETEPSPTPSKVAASAAKGAESIEIPEPLNTEDFKTAWQAFLAERRRRRIKSYTAEGAKAQLARMAAWGVTVAVAQLQLSIAQGYQGIISPSNGNRPPPQNRSGRQGDEHRQWLNGLGANATHLVREDD